MRTAVGPLWRLKTCADYCRPVVEVENVCELLSARCRGGTRVRTTVGPLWRLKTCANCCRPVVEVENVCELLSARCLISVTKRGAISCCNRSPRSDIGPPASKQYLQSYFSLQSTFKLSKFSQLTRNCFVTLKKYCFLLPDFLFISSHQIYPSFRAAWVDQPRVPTTSCVVFCVSMR